MNDYFGSKLYVGDDVLHIYCIGSAAEMCKRVIIGFTKKRVLLARTPKEKGTYCLPGKCYRITGDST